MESVILDHSSRRTTPFIPALKGLQTDKLERLTIFRESETVLQTGFAAESAKEFATQANEILGGVSGERGALDAFGYLAADLQKAVLSLKTIDVMSDDLMNRLMSVYADLVEAALNAANLTDLSLSSIEARNERMREFIEMAKPKVLGYHEFFEHAKTNLEKIASKNTVRNGV